MRTIKVSEIVIPEEFTNSSPNEEKVIAIRQYINQYHKLNKPIVLNGNILVDGYIRYLVAVENQMDEIPFIKAMAYKREHPNSNLSISYITGRFRHGRKEYLWKNDKGIPINIGDRVLVDTAHRHTIAKVDSMMPQMDYNGVDITKELICKLNYSNFEKRKESRKRLGNFKNQMDNIVVQNQNMILYTAIAKENPEMAALLNQYKKLLALTNKGKRNIKKKEWHYYDDRSKRCNWTEAENIKRVGDESAKALDVVNNTINKLSTINEKIDATIDEIAEQKAKL